MGGQGAERPVRTDFEDDSAKLTAAPDAVKHEVGQWLDLFRAYRIVEIRGDEIIQGILLPGLTADHPMVASRLERWDGARFAVHSTTGVEVTLMRPLAPRRPERWWLHLLLAFVTLFTTMSAGAYFAGRNPYEITFLPIGPISIPLPIRIHPAELITGLTFSLALFLVLLGHELGHYVLARRYKMNVSPPFFIPTPPWINAIGTFGAFIRLRSVIVNRIVLLDVGMAGPLASFLLSLPLLVIGLSLSYPMPEVTFEPPTRFAVLFGGSPIWLGGSALFHLADRLFGGGGEFLILHPLAFVGWLGLFVTSMNLFPLAQLDGGHILYALMGERQRYLGMAFLGVLAVLGFSWWGWWLWATAILVLSRGNIGHPAVFDPAPAPTGKRRFLGWLCAAVFILTFAPFPIRL